MYIALVNGAFHPHDGVRSEVIGITASSQNSASDWLVTAAVLIST
jgi:hypothetical protein